MCGEVRSDGRSATRTVAAYFRCQGFSFFFFFEFVSPNVGQVKVSWGNKGFIKAPMFVWSAHVQENQTVFFLKLLQWQKCNWPFIF